MKHLLVALFLVLSNFSFADDKKDSNTFSPFGSAPIQLNIGPEGIKQQKEPGYICDLEASLGSAKYSEWGQTEDDSRKLVHKACSDKSGILICKKDKITCKQDK